MALLPQAIENDRLSFLAGAVMQACRARGIVVPPAAALERLCADLVVFRRGIGTPLAG